jgi:hypothetical protein
MRKTINIKVVTRAKHEKIINFHGGLKVYLNKPPVDGKANKRLIELLAEHFDVSKSQITIARGASSRNKIVMLDVTD